MRLRAVWESTGHSEISLSEEEHSDAPAGKGWEQGGLTGPALFKENVIRRLRWEPREQGLADSGGALLLGDRGASAAERVTVP